MFSRWAALFFCSGAAALVAQIVWSRQLAFIVGASAPATALVLALFMLGLALGARLAAARATRVRDPLRAFALCEAGGGLWALLSLGLTPLLGAAYGALGGGWPVRLGVAALLLLPATMLWGAGLPLITQHWARRRGEAPATVGLLYGVNTLGAAAGAFAAGFVVLPQFGFRVALIGAAGLDLLAGAIAWRLAAREPASAADEAPPAPAAPLGAPVSAALLLLGFASFATEVALTRAMVLHWSSGVYAFAAILTLTLLGTGLGGWLGGRLAARHGAARVLGFALSGAGLAIPLLIVSLGALTPFTLALQRGVGAEAVVRAGLGLLLAAAPFVLPTALLSGMAIPALTRDPSRAGGDLGRIYFINALGNVAGAALAGFTLVPLIGAQGVLLAAGGAWIAAALLAGGARGPALGAALALALAALALPRGTLLRSSPLFGHPGLVPLALEEGVNGTALLSAISEAGPPGAPPDRYLSLQVNGVDVAGTQNDNYSIQKLQAHIPLLLHPDPKSVLHIGVGSGGTAWSASRHPVGELTIAEIAPEVKRTSEKYFRITNHGVFADPRVRFIYDDGRNVLLAARRKWDVILSDSVHPRIAGNGALYTAEYFRLLRSRLNDGGVASMWLPAYTLRPRDFQSIVSAYCSAFLPGGDVAIFYNRATRNRFTVVVARRGGRLEWDHPALVARMAAPGVAADLREIGRERPETLLTDYVVGGSALCDWAAAVRPMSDDRLEAEYGSGGWGMERDAPWWESFDALMAIRGNPRARVSGAPPEFLERLQVEWHAAAETIVAQRLIGRAEAFTRAGDAPRAQASYWAAVRHLEAAWALAPQTREPVDITRAYGFPRDLPAELRGAAPPAPPAPPVP